MYRIFVIENGFDPVYFLDKMSFYELSVIAENLQYKDRSNWEQTRLLSYIFAQANSTKKLTPTDILKFSWDKEESKKEIRKTTMADRKRMQEQAEQRAAQMNNNINQNT